MSTLGGTALVQMVERMWIHAAESGQSVLVYDSEDVPGAQLCITRPFSDPDLRISLRIGWGGDIKHPSSGRGLYATYKGPPGTRYPHPITEDQHSVIEVMARHMVTSDNHGSVRWEQYVIEYLRGEGIDITRPHAVSLDHC